MGKMFTDAEIERLLQLNSCIMKIENGFGILTPAERELYKTITAEDRKNINLLMTMYQSYQAAKTEAKLEPIDPSIISEFQNIDEEPNKGKSGN